MRITEKPLITSDDFETRTAIFNVGEFVKRDALLLQ